MSPKPRHRTDHEQAMPPNLPVVPVIIAQQ